MLNKLLAVMAAAGCAAIVVGLIPESPPAKAAGTPPSMQAPATGNVYDRTAGLSGGDIHNAACAQAWPYYERSCLHDGRQPNGIAREARVVAPQDHRQETGRKR